MDNHWAQHTPIDAGTMRGSDWAPSFLASHSAVSSDCDLCASDTHIPRFLSFLLSVTTAFPTVSCLSLAGYLQTLNSTLPNVNLFFS